jgi:hypothetical protein
MRILATTEQAELDPSCDDGLGSDTEQRLCLRGVNPARLLASQAARDGIQTVDRIKVEATLWGCP